MSNYRGWRVLAFLGGLFGGMVGCESETVVEVVEVAAVECDGAEAQKYANCGHLVVAGLKGPVNGHVVIVVPGSLANNKYPTAYWGSINPGAARQGMTINWSWRAEELDRVIYACYLDEIMSSARQALQSF